MFIKFIKTRLTKHPKKILKILAVFLLITSWLLTGWPGFWITPDKRFPPKIKEAKAASVVIFITSTTDPWTVPSDWSNTNTIEVIGGGGAGAQGGTNKAGGGGGGGAYTKATNVNTITPGSSVRAVVGTGGTTSGGGGGDTYFCKSTSNCTSLAGTDVVAGAQGGSGGTASGNTTLGSNASGGAAASCTGFGTPTCYSGGNGGAGHGGGDVGGGGGGAAGKTGIGKVGGDGQSSTSGGAGGGGGANAGNSTVGGVGTSSTGGAGGHGPTTATGGTAGSGNAGGAGSLGSGGGGGDYNGFTGGAGGGGEVEWTQTSPSQNAGAGGGGGGNADGSTSSTNDAGLYGGGGGGGSHSGFGNGGDGIIVITYTQDLTAPTPNPMTFSTSPNNDADNQISMVASQATDENVPQSAISYLFTNDNSTCTSGHAGNGGTSSSWQLNNLNYSDTGLDANKCYGYKVQAKDTAGNTTTASSVTTTYSSAAVPGTPTLDTPTTSSLKLTNAENGNPASNPTTNFAVQVVTTSPSDSTWLNKWVNSSGNPSDTAVWLSDSQLDGLVLQGLQPGTLYGVKVKAKNNDGDETTLSAEGQGTTTSLAQPAYTQNNFRFYLSADSVTLTDPWPSGSIDLGEKTALIQLPVMNMTLKSGDKIRINMNFSVATANLSASSQAFQIEYTAAEDCTTAGGWTAVGAKGSASIWRLFDEASIGDSTAQVNNLSDSTNGAEGYYSEINPSAVNPNAVNTGQYSEWDWPVENNGAAENTTYCFRMAKSGGTAFDSYASDSYPKITTAPGTSVLMRHGNFFQNSSEKGFFWVN